MAGPCLAIILKNKPTIVEREHLVKSFYKSNQSIVTNNSWTNWDLNIENRPFIFSFGADGRNADSIDSEFINLECCGAKPKAEIGICAMCNSQKDHVVLATIASYIAELFNGLIYIDDYEKIYQKLPSYPNTQNFHYDGIGNFVTADFMKQWIHHPDFRLIK